MKQVIITGATGALGTALIQKCIEEQVQVLVVARPHSKRNQNIPSSALVQVVKLDLSDLKELPKIILNRCEKQDADFDVFYHLGWSGTTGDSRDDADLQLQNVQYTLDAVEVAYQLGCKRFVGTGSQAEYGRTDKVLSPDLPCYPETGYGIAKYTAGSLSRLKCKKLGIEHIWTRVLSVYGPNDNPNSLISYVIKQLYQGDSPELTAGDQVWDYVYAKDAACALFALGILGKDGTIYCVGSGEKHKLKEYLEIVKQQMHSSVPLGFGKRPYAKNQVMFLQADLTNLKRDTGFKPCYSFEIGIQETIKFYQSACLSEECVENR